jgi:predicted DNA-binding transcriptional regulator YafY
MIKEVPLVEFEEKYRPKHLEDKSSKEFSVKFGVDRHTIGETKAAESLLTSGANPMLLRMVAKKGTPTWTAENRHAVLLKFLAQRGPTGATMQDILTHLRSHTNKGSYTPKTVRRDIENFKDRFNYTIDFDRPRQVWVFQNPPPNLTLARNRLSRDEMIALRLAASPIAFPGHPFQQAMQGTLRRIAAMLDADQQQELQNSANLMNVKMTPLIDLNLSTIELIEGAIRQERETTMKYKGLQDGKHRLRRIQPHGLYHRNGGWYLAAYDRAKKAFRSFLISRAREWVLTQKPFKRQKDFTVDGFLGGSFGAMSGRGKAEKVRVRLFGAAARLGEERIWHSSQMVESASRRKDGSVVVSFELRGLDEVRRWILQWEGEAEVLEPKLLKEQIKKVGLKISART